MINIEIDWIKESIRIEDTDKNTHGNVRFAEIELEEADSDNTLEENYRKEVMSMYENGLINMRDEAVW